MRIINSCLQYSKGKCSQVNVSIMGLHLEYANNDWLQKRIGLFSALTTIILDSSKQSILLEIPFIKQNLSTCAWQYKVVWDGSCHNILDLVLEQLECSFFLTQLYLHKIKCIFLWHNHLLKINVKKFQWFFKINCYLPCTSLPQKL